MSDQSRDQDLALLQSTGHGMAITRGCNQGLINHRHYQVLALHLAGKKVPEIEEITGYGPIAISRILNSEKVIQMRQQLLQVYEMEVENNVPEVMNLLLAKMDSEDENIQLRAMDMFFKLFGKYKTKENKGIINLTAEDVVMNILHQGGG